MPHLSPFVQRHKKTTSFFLLSYTPAGLVAHAEGAGRHKNKKRENDELEDIGKNAT
jgi:hypothetical protein